MYIYVHVMYKMYTFLGSNGSVKLEKQSTCAKVLSETLKSAIVHTYLFTNKHEYAYYGDI